MISGHINLQPCEFETHYVPRLNELLSTPTAPIIIGNANGADLMSLLYLLERGYPAKLITIYYHNYNKDHSTSIDKYRQYGVSVVSGFTSYSKRDQAMTADSTEDILWVRPASQTKELLERMGIPYRSTRISGTERNYIRRKQQNA
jgi:hypothetical protein